MGGKNESNIRDPWDNIKCAKQCIIRIPGKERERGCQKYIWRIYAWKLTKPKEGNRNPGTGNTEDGCLFIPNNINPNISTPRHFNWNGKS